ncbi:hypothetical protein LSH36_62g02039 [Paralvinella palmiformis]|uniref:HIT domain-containing protein n=1 Tax=Paralvinella palmiformis TaxID=53620 RepID=A0AAD9NDQ8_9ANNE|nr:hypothetical protein LSH36_62g02039 [Paralvinella palmiformis]
MASKRCVFCTIADKKDPKTTLLYESPEDEDDPLIVFKDIRPAAKHHYLVCTKRHMKDASVLGNNHITLDWVFIGHRSLVYLTSIYMFCQPISKYFDLKQFGKYGKKTYWFKTVSAAT